MSVEQSYTFQNESLVNCLQDLAVRFIINCPEEDLTSSERLFFLLEEAQWFYEDFIRPENPSLPSMKLKQFVERVFHACPILSSFSKDLYADLAKFQSYKNVVPVRGAIILNKKMTKALMVKGWSKTSGWGFPKGKINKDEPDDLCAVREVYEEIGFDISPYLVPEDYVEVVIRQKNIRLYIVRGVPGNTQFLPQTRKEISKIHWHDVNTLPAFNNKSRKVNNKNGHFMVAPFMPGLQRYIKRAKGMASSLSKKESSALKSLLGVKNDENNVDDNDATAAELLNLLKGGGGAVATNDISKPSEDSKKQEPSEKQILLDLLTKNTKTEQPQNDMENAREILSLLRNEMSEHNQLQQVQNVQNLPPLPMAGPLPPIFGANGLPPPPPFAFAPPPPPQFLMGMPPPPPPPGWAPPPPPPNALPQQPHSSHPPPPPPAAPSRLSEPSAADNESLVHYQAPPPPPPPNPILLSALNKRRGRSSISASHQREEDGSRFESYHTKRNQSVNLSEFAKTSGGDGLLSLLNSGNSENANEREKEKEKVGSKEQKQEPEANGSLMHLLRPNVSSQENQSDNVENDKESQDLMNMLNGSKQDKPENDLMSLLGGANTDNGTKRQTRGHAQTANQDLMGLLNGNQSNAKDNTSKPVDKESVEPERVKSPSNNLLDLLQPQDESKPSQPATTAMGLMEGDSVPEIDKPPMSEPSTDMAVQNSNTKPKHDQLLATQEATSNMSTSNNNTGDSLMSLLSNGGGDKNIQSLERTSRPHTPPEQHRAKAACSNMSLMELLNNNGKSPPPPPPQEQPPPGQDLMGLLNGPPRQEERRSQSPGFVAAPASQSKSRALMDLLGEKEKETPHAGTMASSPSAELMSKLTSTTAQEQPATKGVSLVQPTTSPPLPAVAESTVPGLQQAMSEAELVDLMHGANSTVTSAGGGGPPVTSDGGDDYFAGTSTPPGEKKAKAKTKTKQSKKKKTESSGGDSLSQFLSQFNSGKF